MAISTENYSDWSFATGPGWARLQNHGEGNGRYTTGDIILPQGTVSVYRQVDYTRLDFAYGGRVHVRQWDREWGDRTLPRLARELVRDVFDTVLA